MLSMLLSEKLFLDLRNRAFKFMLQSLKILAILLQLFDKYGFLRS